MGDAAVGSVLLEVELQLVVFMVGAELLSVFLEAACPIGPKH
jgi:hypothetical protein